MKPSQTHTWTFRHLLKMRETATTWYRITPGNGRSCRFWKDPWTSLGPLIKLIGSNGPRQTGIPSNAYVSSVWVNGGWVLPPARSDQFEQLLLHLSTITLSSSEDKPHWRINDINRKDFCSNLIYQELIDVKPVVNWWKIVWIKRGIPKHRTLTWMFILNRCPTRDRLLSFGLSVDPMCLLCNQAPESRDHLFFACHYSYSVWSNLALRISRFSSSMDWNNLLEDLISYSGDMKTRYILLLAWQITIYEIWKERNNRLHRQTHRSTDSIIRLIESIIKNRISSFRSQNPQVASEYMQLWLSLV